MMNRRFSVVFVFLVALATQNNATRIDLEELLEILEMVQDATTMMPEIDQIMFVSSSPSIEVPARMMRAMDENLARDNMENAVVRMQTMPPDAYVGELERLPPPDAMDDMRMALAMMENHDRMLRSQIQLTLLKDALESYLPPGDRIDSDSISIGRIGDMDPNYVYKLFGFRRPVSKMRSMPLDVNQLRDYQIDWIPRELLM